jgi:hypothetical protein
MFEDGQLPDAVEPESIPVDPPVAPKRDRRRRLTTVNGNSRVGRRIRELMVMFTEEIGGECKGLRLFKLRRAAELVALAEVARGAALRNGTGATGDLAQLEARAERACKSLGISIF